MTTGDAWIDARLLPAPRVCSFGSAQRGEPLRPCQTVLSAPCDPVGGRGFEPPHPMTEPDVSIRELTGAERAAFTYLREAHLSD